MAALSTAHTDALRHATEIYESTHNFAKPEQAATTEPVAEPTLFDGI